MVLLIIDLVSSHVPGCVSHGRCGSHAWLFDSRVRGSLPWLGFPFLSSFQSLLCRHLHNFLLVTFLVPCTLKVSSPPDTWQWLWDTIITYCGSFWHQPYLEPHCAVFTQSLYGVFLERKLTASSKAALFLAVHTSECQK